MKIEKCWIAYFSPTGGTKRIARLLAGEMAETLRLPVEEIDITLPENRRSVRTFSETDLLLLALPVYAGRIPNKILPDVDRLFEGRHTPAVAVSVFGNRSFDEALMENALLLDRHGFTVFAAAGAANRHVFSPKIAPDRPDEEDVAALQKFARESAQKLLSSSNTEELRLPLTKLPGHNPPGPYYTPLGDDGMPARFLKAKPIADPGKCTRCGACAAVCPMGSIDKADASQTFGVCIKCHACIRSCPSGARYFDDERFLSHVRMLEQNYTRRAENQFYV